MLNTNRKLCKSSCQSLRGLSATRCCVYACHFHALEYFMNLTFSHSFSSSVIKVSSWWHHVLWLSRHAILPPKSCRHGSKWAQADAVGAATVPEVEGQRVSKFFVRKQWTSFQLYSPFKRLKFLSLRLLKLLICSTFSLRQTRRRFMRFN